MSPRICTDRAFLLLLLSCNGGGGFFLDCEDFGRMFDHSFPACAFLFLFFKVENRLRTLISLLGQDQSTVAQRAETTVAECSLTVTVVVTWAGLHLQSIAVSCAARKRQSTAIFAPLLSDGKRTQY